ncbi:MAG: hypothetical protein ABWW65_06290 [Thermoprotei archaeon]
MVKDKHRTRITRGRHRSILDFISSGGEAKGNEATPNTDRSISEPGPVERGRDNTGVAAAVLEDFLKELKKRRTTSKPEKEEEKSIRGIEEVILSKTPVPSGKVLDEILERGLGIDDVRCDNTGRCSDGHNIGDVFTDSYGFKRQRGFVNTTRLPVFLDWIVEEAVVQKVLPRAYSVKTSRGSIALIPEDFLCELHTRYGVILKNYDKCVNYKPVIGRETVKSRRKR